MADTVVRPQVLACIATSDAQLQNPPCQQGSALVAVDPVKLLPSPYEGAEYGAGTVILVGAVAYFLGRSVKVVKGW